MTAQGDQMTKWRELGGPVTQQQAYDVLREYPDFELRRYPDHLIAEVEVGGPFELVGNLAFPRLARYIGGHNRSSRNMVMTAPVVQQQNPRSRRYVVGFVMPADVSAEDLPDPLDSHVHTRRVPAEAGAPRFARFDPPWTLWFLRRNEVVVPVAA